MSYGSCQFKQRGICELLRADAVIDNNDDGSVVVHRDAVVCNAVAVGPVDVAFNQLPGNKLVRIFAVSSGSSGGSGPDVVEPK